MSRQPLIDSRAARVICAPINTYPEILNDPTVYPPEPVLNTLFLLKPLPAQIKRLEGRLWAHLKSGS